MTEPLFERYKAALRRGHVAALAGRLEDALGAYREAATLVPERALPLASQGTVLHRLDRWPEAAESFERALKLAPDDEATLRARATAREERGLRSGAAADFERLAFVLDVAGRAQEAAEAARRAVDLESTPGRTSLLARLEGARGRADLDADAGAADAGAADEITGQRAAAVAHEEDDGRAGIEPEVAAPARIVPETAAEAARAARTEDPAESWPALDMPSPAPPPIEGPPPDPEVLLAEAVSAMDAGDQDTARERMLTAVAVHRTAGRLDAALDVCLQVLAMAPGDPQVHLAIANLQLDHGWTALATEKIELLRRLTALTGDTQAEADVHGLAAERLRDEPAPVMTGR